MTAQRPLTDDTAQQAWLRQLLNWLIPIAVVAALVDAVLAAIFALPVVAAIVVLTFCEVGVFLWCRLALGRRPIQTIVLVLVLSILALICLVWILLPNILAVTTSALIIPVALALPYVTGITFRRLSFLTGALALLLMALGRSWEGFAPLPPQAVDVMIIVVAPMAIMLVLLLLWQFHSRLGTSLQQAHEANAALAQSRAGLETQVAERTAALQAAMDEIEARAAAQERLVEELRDQRAAIRELSVPILPVSRGTLVMPLVGALDSERLRQVQERALRAVEAARARHLVLDVTGVPVIDAQVARGLLQVVQSALLLGTRTTLVGIRPEVAQTLVGLNVDLASISTRSALRDALEDKVATRGST